MRKQFPTNLFLAIGKHALGTVNNLVQLRQVRLPNFGTFQFVIVRHKALWFTVEDFVAVEIPGGGNFIAGKGAAHFRESARVLCPGLPRQSGDSAVWRRALPDMLAKGALMEHWGRRIYWAFDKPVFADFQRHVGLENSGARKRHGPVFASYSARKGGEGDGMKFSRWHSLKSGDPLRANNLPMPSEEQFVRLLQRKFEREMRRAIAQGMSAAQARAEARRDHPFTEGAVFRG